MLYHRCWQVLDGWVRGSGLALPLFQPEMLIAFLTQHQSMWDVQAAGEAGHTLYTVSAIMGWVLLRSQKQETQESLTPHTSCMAEGKHWASHWKSRRTVPAIGCDSRMPLYMRCTCSCFWGSANASSQSSTEVVAWVSLTGKISTQRWQRKSEFLSFLRLLNFFLAYYGDQDSHSVLFFS